MLSRILEAEVMDTPDEARDYDSMDHSRVNAAFVDDLLAGGVVEGDVLDLGTGTAQIPVALCKRAADCRVMAVDAARQMLELAIYNIEIAGFGERIQLDWIDAKKLPYPDGLFHLVMSNSIVHHIPEPRDVLHEAVRVTAPGGRLFFRDLARPDSLDALHRIVDQYAAGESEHARQMFAASLHAALTLDEVRALVADLGFAPTTVRMTSDRHWTWDAMRPANSSS